jgi:hypothetical protein
VKTFFINLWRVAVCLVQLAVIVYVFDRLNTRSETILVSLLGLIYATIRSLAIMQELAFAQFAFAIEKELAQIQELLGEYRNTITERRRAVAVVKNNLYGGKLIINAIFIGVLSLICLFVLFGALSNHQQDGEGPAPICTNWVLTTMAAA